MAIKYADGPRGTVYEIEMGMVDRGADLSFLSQYPHEREVIARRLPCPALTSTPPYIAAFTSFRPFTIHPAL